jgi:hypothetical protein
MAIVEGSLSFLPNRCVCIAYSYGYLSRLVSTLARRPNQKVGRAPDLQEMRLRHARVGVHGDQLN